MPTYHVTLHRDAARALPTMPAHIREAAITYIEEVLHHSPLTRIPGKTKQLKGRLAGLLQYDLPSGYRLWYRVDQATRTVMSSISAPIPDGSVPHPRASRMRP